MKKICFILAFMLFFSSALMCSCNVSYTEDESVIPITESPTQDPQEQDEQSQTEEADETETEPIEHHVWNDATCDMPKTCQLCGETDGESAGHTGGLATCVSKAVCVVCGEDYGTEGKHVYDAKVIDPKYQKTKASLTAGAWYYYSCSFCGKKGTTAFNSGITLMTATINAYTDLYKDSTEGEKFLFFTDPHYITTGEIGKWNPAYSDHLSKMKMFYDAAEVSFTLCGGDWFNNTNTRENALDMMALIKNELSKNFGSSYLVLGNHDYNYQYVTDGKNGKSPYWLTVDEISSAWYPEYGKTYYTFNGENTKFYVFDSGIDWGHSSLTDLDKEQIVWFLNELSKNDDAHIALAPHMVSNSGIHVATQKYAEIGNVYNMRGVYEYDGIGYDFSNKTGMVEFIIAGHDHADKTGIIEGIPYILTCNAGRSTSTPTFDLVYVDYTARKLGTVRIGTGEPGREIALPEKK